jgi:hypothetical protein
MSVPKMGFFGPMKGLDSAEHEVIVLDDGRVQATIEHDKMRACRCRCFAGGGRKLIRPRLGTARLLERPLSPYTDTGTRTTIFARSGSARCVAAMGASERVVCSGSRRTLVGCTRCEFAHRSLNSMTVRSTSPSTSLDSFAALSWSTVTSQRLTDAGS